MKYKLRTIASVFGLGVIVISALSMAYVQYLLIESTEALIEMHDFNKLDAELRNTTNTPRIKSLAGFYSRAYWQSNKSRLAHLKSIFSFFLLIAIVHGSFIIGILYDSKTTASNKSLKNGTPHGGAP